MGSLGFQTSPMQNPNVCTDPYTPSFWLGKPGALTQLRMPGAGWPRASSDNFAVQSLLDGMSVDRSPYLRRTWQFSYEWLKPDVMSVLMEYATRQRGVGPFILIDPQMKNLLTPNQASGTDALHSSEGFAITGVAGVEQLSSNTSWFAQGERSLQWSWLPVTGSAGQLRVTTPTGLYGFCAPPGATFAFSGQIRSGGPADGPGGALMVTPQVVFMNGVGAVQSTVRASGQTAVLAVTGSATSFCVTGLVPSAPTGTYFEPQFIITGAPSVGVMNANPYFETDVSNWTPTGASVVRDGTAFEGSFSMLVTPDGVTSGPQVVSEEVVVVAGSTYTVNAFYRLGGGGTGSRDVGVLWYNAAHSLIGTSVVSMSSGPGIWSPTLTSYQAPIGAAFARLVTRGTGVLAGSNVWRIDAFILASTKPTIAWFDQLQLELTPTGQCTQWEYGQGQPLVAVRGDSESVPRILRTNMGYVMVEVT